MIPPLFAGLCDDAAIFPPGSLPLPEAVPAHRRHLTARHADLVGPLVVTAAALDQLAPLVDPAERIDVAVTLPAGPSGLPGVLAAVGRLPVRLRAVEVAVPAAGGPDEFFMDLKRARGAASEAASEAMSDAAVFVEVPRDGRGPGIIAGCAAHGYAAKFRTGGVRADLYPDETELAGSIAAAVDAGVPFKATAGLHRAIRNTDPETGFEQHGFLNVLLAVDAARRGAGRADLAALLAERAADAVAAGVAGLAGDAAHATRDRFVSFGTCGIADPLADLIGLGLIDA